MIHLMENGGVVDVIKDLLPYIKYKNYYPQTVRVDQIIHKGLDIPETSIRYKMADTKYPLVLQKGEKGYKLVDGRHRLLKLLKQGSQIANAFVLEEYEINLFRK